VFLSLAADGLWIIALSIMASASRNAWKRIAPGAPTPLPLVSARRAKPGAALSLIPAAAFVAGAALLVAHRAAPTAGPVVVVWFCLRAIAAALFALACLRYLQSALETLAREGQLRP